MLGVPPITAQLALGNRGSISPKSLSAEYCLVDILHAMAKVMISIPDDLLGKIDAEVKRRQTSRSNLLREAARREIGILRRERADVLDEMDRLSAGWSGDLDAAALVRSDRLRRG